ncbi:ABC transporter substrate-binding protein [Desulfonema magnum]|nr:ABC transporter substrate-binding protein [Desulfonema magnum]
MLRVICHVAMPWVIGNQVVEPLIYVDNQNNFIPCLAESYQIYDTYMDVYLRKNVVFQDGTCFDASSVIMNWDAYQRTASPYFTIDMRMGVKNIEAMSPYHLKIQFKDNGLTGLILVYLRSFYIYSKGYFKHSKGIYPPGNQGNMLKAGPWGTGPYILRQLSEETGTAILEKNPSYWQEDRPGINTVIMYGAKKYDTIAAHHLMKQGQADIFDAVMPSMIHIMAQSSDIHMAVKRPLSCFNSVFNMRKPNSPLRDIRIRKALNLLIDRRTLLKYISHQTARMTPFIFPLFDKEENLQPYPYEPENAKELLRAAGYDTNHSLSITIGYFASEKKMAYAIGAMLEEGGVRAHFQEYRSRYEFYKHFIKQGRGPEKPMENEIWDINIMHSGIYTNSVATHFGENFVSRGGYRWILPDPKADEMFFLAAKQKNLKMTEQSLKEMEKYLYHQYYMMPIYIRPTIIAVHKRVAGSPLSASGYLLNLKEIRFNGTP